MMPHELGEFVFGALQSNAFSTGSSAGPLNVSAWWRWRTSSAALLDKPLPMARSNP